MQNNKHASNNNLNLFQSLKTEFHDVYFSYEGPN